MTSVRICHDCFSGAMILARNSSKTRTSFTRYLRLSPHAAPIRHYAESTHPSRGVIRRVTSSTNSGRHFEKQWRARKPDQAREPQERIDHRFKRLDHAVRTENLPEMIAAYRALPSDNGNLQKADFFRLAFALFHIVFRITTQKDGGVGNRSAEVAMAFATQLTEDVQKGVLPVSPSAYVHLLRCFRHSPSAREHGKRFWTWLESQEDAYTSHDVYACAIELYAHDGASLSFAEDLYATALSRFPVGFASYHLSPHAVVPNRDERTSVKGLPATLLKAMIIARLMRGATKEAYLALDALFRLFPDQVPKGSLEDVATERPASEIFLASSMWLRLGDHVRRRVYRELHATLNPQPDATLERIVVGLRIRLVTMFNQDRVVGGSSLHSYYSALSASMLDITSLSQRLVVMDLDISQRRMLTNKLLDVVERLLEILAPRVTLDVAICNALLSHFRPASGDDATRILDLVEKTLANNQLASNDVTDRCRVILAGRTGSADFLRQEWRTLVIKRKPELRHSQFPLGKADFKALKDAAHWCGIPQFAASEFECYRLAILHSEAKQITGFLQRPPPVDPPLPPSVTEVTADEALGMFEKYLADIEVFAKYTADKAASISESPVVVPSSLYPLDGDLAVSEDDMRTLYDKFTTVTEPSTPEPSNPSENQLPSDDQANAETTPNSETQTINNLSNLSVPGDASPTSVVPYAKLRYAAWKDILALLQISEKHDRAFNEEIDAAIAAGRMPVRNRNLTDEELKKIGDFGLSSFPKPGELVETKPASGVSLERAEVEIRRLRGMGPAAVQQIMKDLNLTQWQ